VLAGGALASPGFWRGWAPGLRAALGLAIVLAGAVTFSNLGGVQDRSTFAQDHVLLARAAYTVGDDETALSEAREALKIQPWHPDAKAIEEAAYAEMARKPKAP
jgi:Tfp pilus assembly protein PilF